MVNKKKDGMNVLSLFDGMSCFQIVLMELGVPIEGYYASEIDKHAISQTQLNFPSTVQLGDVRNVDVGKLPYIDFLAGGSPCQSFSFAGKRNGMTTKENVEIYTLEHYLQLKHDGFEFEGQSYLFWEYVRVLRDIRAYNPDVLFLLENVEMEARWERVISDALDIYGVHINSSLVSAQNRERIYWTNIRSRKEGLFGELYSDIPQPVDRGIFLKDIIEDDVDDKYYIHYDKDKLIYKKNYAVIGYGYEQDNRAYYEDGKSGTLDLKCKSRQKVLLRNGRIRRLTPTECARLQTIPDWYKWGCSDTQAYRMLGNGWNIETVKHIVSFAVDKLMNK